MSDEYSKIQNQWTCTSRKHLNQDQEIFILRQLLVEKDARIKELEHYSLIQALEKIAALEGKLERAVNAIMRIRGPQPEDCYCDDAPCSNCRDELDKAIADLRLED